MAEDMDKTTTAINNPSVGCGSAELWWKQDGPVERLTDPLSLCPPVGGGGRGAGEAGHGGLAQHQQHRHRRRGLIAAVWWGGGG